MVEEISSLDRGSNRDRNSDSTHFKASWQRRLNGNLAKTGKNSIYFNVDHGP
jgi:hypothetical protein